MQPIQALAVFTMGAALKMNDAFRERIVEISRRWVGTAYSHQASLEGVGADCLGLFRGVWRELYGAEPAALPTYSPDWSVGDRERLYDAAARFLSPVASGDEMQGDVILFRMREKGPAKHLGVLAKDAGRAPTFIHAYSLHGVVETALTAAWQRRVVGYFAFPSRSS